jgi:hypothetical protein
MVSLWLHLEARRPEIPLAIVKNDEVVSSEEPETTSWKSTDLERLKALFD